MSNLEASKLLLKSWKLLCLNYLREDYIGKKKAILTRVLEDVAFYNQLNEENPMPLIKSKTIFSWAYENVPSKKDVLQGDLPDDWCNIKGVQWVLAEIKQEGKYFIILANRLLVDKTYPHVIKSKFEELYHGDQDFDPYYRAFLNTPFLNDYSRFLAYMRNDHKIASFFDYFLKQWGPNKGIPRSISL